MTVTALSRLSGIARQSLHAILDGTRQPRMTNSVRIMQALSAYERNGRDYDRAFAALQAPKRRDVVSERSFKVDAAERKNSERATLANALRSTGWDGATFTARTGLHIDDRRALLYGRYISDERCAVIAAALGVA